MTPHGAFESMKAVATAAGPQLYELFEKTAWDACFTGLLGKSVHFDYGDHVPTIEHTDFAHDLDMRGLLRWPFNTVFMYGKCSPKNGFLVVQGGGENEQIPETKKMIIIFSPVVTGDTPAVAQQSFPAAPTMVVWTDGDGDRINWQAATHGLQHSRKTREEFGEPELEDRARRAWNLVRGWTVMLMSKDVEQVIVPAPKRLNQRRERKGKLAIRECRVIKIKSSTLREIGADHLDMERSSPRMHWRRGHFRTLPSGVVVPVAPTIVNATEGAKPLAKSYVFEGAGS